MNDQRGSLWRKWDLQVHTPASIEQKYGGPTEENWRAFITDLESLPPEFKVLGVNDYIFLDGYKRLKAEKAKGRLANIDLLLPVVELRIDKFAGTEGHLRRLNYHILFSDELSTEVIEQHFLNGIMVGYHLSPQYHHLGSNWRGLLTRDSLQQLGQLIIDSAPAEKRQQFDDALTEGFRNVNISLDKIRDLLHGSLFEGKYLCGVGKAEWAQMRWSGSIAEKKNVINDASIVFIASESPAHWTAARTSLTSAGVNDRLLDCSDAHALSSSADKDRIGNCFTWIKADTTFEGLRQALHEPDERIFVGDEPEQLRRVRENRTKYVKSLRITKAPGSTLAEQWFDIDLPLNHGLIAIIGNRGMGKSALADTLAVLGDSHSRRFSFLDENHFCNPKDNKARHFMGTLTWESGQDASRLLHDTASRSAAMRVRYVPQNLFEEICNELPGSGKGVFGQELSDVIFSHVKDRYDCNSLEELIRLKTDEADRSLNDLRSKLRTTNLHVARLEAELAPGTRKALEEKKAAKAEELRVHDESRPADMAQPTTDVAVLQQLDTTRTSLDAADAEIAAIRADIGKAKKRQLTLQRVLSRLDRFEKQVAEARRELDEDLVSFSLQASDLLTVRVDREPVVRLEQEAAQEITTLGEKIDEGMQDNLWSRKRTFEAQIASLQSQLDGPASEYQKYVAAQRAWKTKRDQIVGDVGQADSLASLESRLKKLTSTTPAELATAVENRDTLMVEIFRGLQGLAATYRDLYRPVQDFLDKHAWVRQELKLEFAVSLEEQQFGDGFFGQVSHGKKGPFHGIEEGRKRMTHLLSAVDFNDEQQVVTFIHDLLTSLADAPGGTPAQLKSGRVELLYDFVCGLEYVRPRYTLNVGGRGIESLSPGERGMLLLVFYLLVDQGDIPLIIDQPEENLDNQSVFRLLVPCIKEVRARRQIVLVTHNPNLAVVCDAEQVVHAFIDKEEQNRVVYTAGAIENPVLNRKIVDVLEGTWPAFTNRSVKYSLFPPSNVDALEVPLLGRLEGRKLYVKDDARPGGNQDDRKKNE
jgi:ABC-type lipoprotein export system ATPase subunit